MLSLARALASTLALSKDQADRADRAVMERHDRPNDAKSYR
jgi:hypothetical protein